MTPENYAVKAMIGVVPQDVAVFDELSVQENIDYFAVYMFRKEKRKALIEEVIQLVGLENMFRFVQENLVVA